MPTPTSRRSRTGATTPAPVTPPETTRSQAASRRARARKGEGQLLRKEILVAAEELLLATGSAEAVSIRAVADAVGVTPPSIYRHFPDKTTLIYEVCARHFVSLDAAIDAAVAGITDPLLELQARGRAYVEFGRANPEPYRIMFMVRPEQGPAEAAQHEWLNEARTFLDTIANVQRCIDAGAFRPEFDDALLVALGFWARVHGITSLMVSKPNLAWSEDAFIEKYLETCLHGIADR